MKIQFPLHKINILYSLAEGASYGISKFVIKLKIWMLIRCYAWSVRISKKEYNTV